MTMALFPNTTGTAALIQHLDYLQLGGTSGTFSPPFINGPLGLKYLDPMPYANWEDFTTDGSSPMFDVPFGIVLGDIFGALYEPLRLPQLAFGGAIFNPTQQSLPMGGGIFYTVTKNPFNTDATFGQPSTFVFGKVAFGYDGGGGVIYFGEWKWMNFVNGALFAERPNPIAFVCYPKPGVELSWSYDGGGPLYGAGMQIAGEVNSFYTGNLPALGH
jgi:hypothetical protein